jgi:hypothetical protein
VVLAGPLPKPREIFDRAKLEAKHPGLLIANTLDAALRIAEELTSVPVHSRSSKVPPPDDEKKKSAA